ncbi:NAD(P)H-binding protein [Embleya sp. NPDC005575]|uniref:SDR family oxidoreductase n=1 Tax=Embleya sp. NPDC005575 TaxID=3156892 RepID=UPI00339E5AE4
MILVTGATGNVGRQVVDQLLAAGVAVRALARRPEAAGLPAEVEVVGGDLAEPDTLAAALTGVDAVFLVWPFLTTDGAPGVLDAVTAQTGRVVYLSSSRVRDDVDRQADPISGLHAEMERVITKSTAVWTFLRADTIASNALGWAGQIRASGVVHGPDLAAKPVVHERDVAASAVRVLTEDGHAGATYVLTGPEVVSRADQVRLIGAAIDRPLRFEPVPVAAARAQMLADGRPPALVDALLAGADTPPEPPLITTTIRDLTGAPARSFETWAQDHRPDFA